MLYAHIHSPNRNMRYHYSIPVTVLLPRMMLRLQLLILIVTVALNATTRSFAFTSSTFSSSATTMRNCGTLHSNSKLFFFFSNSNSNSNSNSKQTQTTEPEWSAYQTYPEANPATYDLLSSNPFDITTEGFVRPLLKQTQLENRKLKVAYDANRDGYDARIFHQKVDGKGAAIVLCKAGNSYFGGYNPRGWASLAGARSSKAAFLFYKSGPFSSGPWKKLRALNRGGNSISVDLQDQGIYFGADGLVIPLRKGSRDVASRLGGFYERGNDPPRNTILPSAGRNTQLQELKVLVGVYAPGEDIPNSAGVSELGFY